MSTTRKITPDPGGQRPIRAHVEIGDTVTLHVWNGSWFSKVEGIVEDLEPTDDYDGDTVVILENDDVNAFLLSQVVFVMPKGGEDDEMPEKGSTVFDVPVSCLVTVDADGKVTRVALSCRGSDAGYLGETHSLYESSGDDEQDDRAAEVVDGYWEGVEWDTLPAWMVWYS